MAPSWREGQRPWVGVRATPLDGADALRWRDGDVLRKVFLTDGRVTGFRFTGEVSGGGILRSFLLRGEDVRRYGRRVAAPGFGMSELVLPAVGVRQ